MAQPDVMRATTMATAAAVHASVERGEGARGLVEMNEDARVIACRTPRPTNRDAIACGCSATEMSFVVKCYGGLKNFTYI